jgi:trigger factor
MKVKVEDVEKNVKLLEIEVDKEKFDEGLKKAFQKNKNHFMIPGFRKGKAPMHIVTRQYGEEILYEDTINDMCPKIYDDAIEQEKLEPVDRPEFDIKTIGKDENLVFTVKVTVKPEVKLGEYKGLEIEEKKAKVSAADVNDELSKMQERNARLIPVEDRAVENGDTANIDFEGFKDDVAFEGGKAEGHNLEIGSNSFIPGFEEQIIGKNKGDEFDIEVTFPEKYQQEDLAGQKAVFKIKINDIKKKELPELDDDFAQDISEFDTLDEYKKDIKKKLMETREKQVKSSMENEVIKKAADVSEVEIPDCMIERRIDDMLNEFDMTLRYQGMSLDAYFQSMGITKDEFRKTRKEDAENDVKAQLVLEAISEKEKIETNDEDFKKELEEMAKSYNRKVEDIEKTLTDEYRDNIKDGIKNKKTIALLLEAAKLVEAKPEKSKNDKKEDKK